MTQLDYPNYPSISKEAFRKKYKKLMIKRLEAVTNRLISNFLFSLANKLFIRKKIYNAVEESLFDELDKAGLIKE